jgi:hypothetical protein
VDVVLGQPDPWSSEPNQGGAIGPDTLRRPRYVRVGPGGDLYVSDNSGEGGTNRRLLVFDADLFPDDLDHVLYAVPATRAIGTGERFTVEGCVDPMCAPMEVGFGPRGEMVVGMGAYNPNGQRFPLAYLNVLDYPYPHMALGDFSACPKYSHMDEEGNLYVGDGCWARVLVFKKPFLHFEAAFPRPVSFVRGDVNADGGLDIGDAIFTLTYFFLDGAAPPCLKSADADDGGAVDLADAIYLLSYLFAGGLPPAPPFEGCGTDSTADSLPCAKYEPCE